MRYLFVVVVALSIAPTASGQNDHVSPNLVICGGGSLPDTVFQRFLKLAGPRPSLIVIPTASQRAFDVEEVQKLWRSRGFQNVSILHNNDRDVASSGDFAAPLKTATAIWFGGGSQQRIADAYLDTPVETEVYQLLRRGGVVGGTSAGAAIQSRVMIASGGSDPKISTGLDLLPGTIVDQHFLKRNRVPRLLSAIRAHPHLIGMGIDESTALVVHDGKAEVVGRSYLLRVESVDGTIKLDAFSHGDAVPLTDHHGGQTE
jgi:cyanophycinase